MSANSAHPDCFPYLLLLTLPWPLSLGTALLPLQSCNSCGIPNQNTHLPVDRGGLITEA